MFVVLGLALARLFRSSIRTEIKPGAARCWMRRHRLRI
jgi:hypothetical protein